MRLFGLLFVLPLASASLGCWTVTTHGREDAGSADEGDESTGEPPAECACLGSEELTPWLCDPLQECGAYAEYDTDDPCHDDATGGGTGGGTDPCAERQMENDATIACALQAAAAGEAFHLTHTINDQRQYSHANDYYVAPDAPLRIRSLERRDLTGDVIGMLRATPSFEACQGLGGAEAWGCMLSAMSTEAIAECFSFWLDSGYGIAPSPEPTLSLRGRAEVGGRQPVEDVHP